MTCYYASLLLQCLQPHRTVFQYTSPACPTAYFLHRGNTVSLWDWHTSYVLTDPCACHQSKGMSAGRSADCFDSLKWIGMDWIRIAGCWPAPRKVLRVYQIMSLKAILVNDLNSVQRLMRWQKSAQIYGLLSIQLSFSSVSRTVQGQQPHPWPQEPAWESSHTTLYKL